VEHVDAAACAWERIQIRVCELDLSWAKAFCYAMSSPVEHATLVKGKHLGLGEIQIAVVENERFGG
jgi:hypothetical protein